LGAREDAFYLHPDCRGKGYAPKILGYAEHFLRKLGCVYAGMTDKSPVGGAPIGEFLKKQGYGLVAHYYVKELEK
jgi:GNAT superfamily N-acetyltransferase